jgi:hypothetical protein
VPIPRMAHFGCVMLGVWVSLSSNAMGQPVVLINEVMASNGRTIADPQGGFDDWIELYNPGRGYVDVGGMYLTDDPAVPRKWRIPAGLPGQRGGTSISPRGYLLIWADGDVLDSGLHASFRLDADGDAVHLLAADGLTPIDSLVFEGQTPDVSYGRYPDGGGTLQFFGVPTPGQANSEGYLGEVAPLRFSHERGFYSSAFDVTIETATEGAQIFYTLDGYAPHEPRATLPIREQNVRRRTGTDEEPPAAPAEPRATLYTGPIRITKTTCLRVVAEKPGWKPTSVYTQTYILDPTPQLQTLPAISLVGGPGTVFYEPNGVMAIVGGTYPNGVWAATDAGSYNNMVNRDLERPVSAEWFFPTDDEGFQIDCGLRVHGSPYIRPRYVRQEGPWSGNGKISLRLYFRGQYGQRRLEYPLIPQSESKQFATVVLRAGHNDRTNPFIKDELLRRLHRDMGQAACIGTSANLFIDGEYKGFYNVTEQVKEESCQEWFESDKPWDVMTMNGVRDGDSASFDAMISYARTHNLADAGYYAELCQKLDVASFIDYLIIRLWPNDWDWPQNNWSAACERSASGRWKFFVWDAEGTFVSSQLQLDRFGELSTQSNANGYLYQALKANADFRRLFGDRLQKHFFHGGALTEENIRRRFNELREELRSVIPSMDSYLIDGWTPNRLPIFLTACAREGLYTAAAPEFAVNGVPQHGGQVAPGDRLSMTAGGSRGMVYYTLDGSDPARADNLLGPAATTLVAPNAAKRVLIPTGPVPDTWRTPETFDDSSWIEATGSPGGIGFGRGSGFAAYFSTNLGGRMYNTNGSCYIRCPFQFGGDPEKLVALTLLMQYDDGFIAYLNGTEIARRNFAGVPAWDSVATTSRDNAEAVEFESIDLSDRTGLLQPGANMLALQGLNNAVTGSDFLIGVEMVAVEQSAPSDPTGPQMYVTPIPLTKTTVVKARVRTANAWGPLAEAAYAVGPVKDGLRISEIMYHPPDAGQPTDPNGEYVELTNIGDEAIDLNLVKFTRGIQFTFPEMQLAPHAFCLVVRDQAAFEAGYGPGLPVAGQYTGSLSDNGERIELRDAAGGLIHGFSYRDDWFRTTDGDGFSLTVRYPAEAPLSSWNVAGAWRPSASLAGSPGSDDSGTIPGAGAVVLNELLANPGAGGSDWLELHNTTDRTLDLGGWFLSDDADDLAKYEMPPGTTIPPEGFLVLTEEGGFGKTGAPGCHRPFGLSQAGETIYLCSGDRGRVTGYREQARFSVSEAGMTLGRFVDGAGVARLVPLQGATPGGANADPAVGPVVFTEILYHADQPGDVEYVELQNITDTEVILYDFYRAAPWRFAGGRGEGRIELLFPQDPPLALAPHAYLLLTKDRSVLESRFGVLPSVPVLDWGVGRLTDAGDTIELSRPGEIVNDIRTWIAVDRMTYSDGSHPDDFPAGVDPWPAQADGGGQSLARTDRGRWGDDPLNWRALVPTPGVARLRTTR